MAAVTKASKKVGKCEGGRAIPACVGCPDSLSLAYAPHKRFFSLFFCLEAFCVHLKGFLSISSGQNQQISRRKKTLVNDKAGFLFIEGF